jgi:hypothetical protein
MIDLIDSLSGLGGEAAVAIDNPEIAGTSASKQIKPIRRITDSLEDQVEKEAADETQIECGNVAVIGNRSLFRVPSVAVKLFQPLVGMGRVNDMQMAQL